MSCGDGGPMPLARSGYNERLPVFVGTSVPRIDWTLQPFDKMGEATVTSTWTEVVAFAIPQGQYGHLLFIGQDCNDATAYQRVSWRVLRNSGGVGGDENGLMPNLEARCGILDGTMMPFELFVPEGGRISIEAQLTSPNALEESTVVRARVQGKRRANQGGGTP